MEGVRRCYAQGCVLCAALREREAAKVKTKATLPPSARGVLSKNPASHAANHAERQSTVQATRKPHAASVTAKSKHQPSPADADQKQLQRALARSRQTAAEEAEERPSVVGGSLSSAEHQYRSLMRALQERDITPEDYDLLLRLDEAIPKKNVLSDEALALVLDVVESQDVDVDGECSICVGDLDQGEPAGRLCCGHVYHLCCIRQWLTTGRDTCPMCGTQQCVAHGGGP